LEDSTEVAQNANAKIAEHRIQEPSSFADHTGLLNLVTSPRALSRINSPALMRSSKKPGAASR